MLATGLKRTKQELDVARFIKDQKQIKSLLKALTTARMRDLARNTSGLSITRVPLPAHP